MDHPSLSTIGEDQLIRHITQDIIAPSNVLTGIGDDCAVIQRDATRHTLLKTDTIVEHIHFLPSTEPERVGWKAVARVLSDFASMGGSPEALVITIILPPETPVDWVAELYKGITRCAKQHNCAIVGGETSSSPAESPISITVSGTATVAVGKQILRSSAQAGDLLFVTGTLGGSIEGKHLDFTPRLDQGRWLSENGFASAMMDLSDGIGKDLPRLARASQLSYHLDSDKLPINDGCTPTQALADGEDYELLFTCPAQSAIKLSTLWKNHFPALPLSHIGEMLPSDTSPSQLIRGFEHFR